MTADATMHIPHVPTQPSANDAPAFALFDVQYMRTYGTEHIAFDAARGNLTLRNPRRNLPAAAFVHKCLDLERDVDVLVRRSCASSTTGATT